MLIRIYLVYYSWALFCAFGGWVKPITNETSLFNNICYACWGNSAGFMFLVFIPLIIFIPIFIYYGIYTWISNNIK